MKIKKFDEYVLEQAMGGLLDMPDLGADVGVIDQRNLVSEEDYKASLKSLFNLAKSAKPARHPQTKTRIKSLQSGMEGPGTVEPTVRTVLKSLANIGELADLVLNWTAVTGSGQSLYDWLIGDLSAKEVWHALPGFKEKSGLKSVSQQNA